jgi:hypothetical protein
MNRLGTCVSIGLALTVVAGCDPGVAMRPIGLQRAGESGWARDQNGIQFVTRGIGGLVGTLRHVPELGDR